MKKISTFRLALWAGVFTEIIACGLVLFSSGGYSSYAPTHSHAFSNFISFIVMFHLPGIWLVLHLPIGFLTLPFMILGGMAQFVILFWMGISIWKRLHTGSTSAQLPKPN